MAADNSPGAVHFTLAGFVLATLLLLVVTYMLWSDLSTSEDSLAAAKDELNTANAALNTALADVTALKNKLGLDYAEVGSANPAPNTVMGELDSDLQVYGAELADNTVRSTLGAMRTRIDELLQENTTLKDSMQEMQERLLALQTGYQNQLDQVKQSQETSETSLQTQIQDTDEQLTAKDQQIDTLRKDLSQEQIDKEAIRDQLSRMRKDLSDQIANLEQMNNALRERLEEVTRTSFEKPDGEIVSVDNTTRSVWLNLGEQDNLPTQVNFSVYSTDHRGVGRTQGDIKGKIEITRILGPHLAEARILDEELYRPIAPGDPIYSPIWQSGRQELFSFVGLFDLDNDGDEDRQMLHEILEGAGAGVEVEVDSEGLRNPPNAKLSVKTKFLVIGEIPDPSQFPGNDEKRERATRIGEQRTKLVDEARQQGIRVINLNDFLSFIGWRPTKRVFVPGDPNRRYNLRGGARSTGVNEPLGGNSSSGNTSRLFRQNRANEQNESSGQTSGAYRD